MSEAVTAKSGERYYPLSAYETRAKDSVLVLKKGLEELPSSSFSASASASAARHHKEEEALGRTQFH
jgi:hypothetical protein